MPPSTNTFPSRVTSGTFTLWITAPVVFAAAVWISWTGYLGSDDALYAGVAIHWLQHGPFLGTTHFALRLTTVLPIIASFKLFGVSEFALILPTLLCGVAVVAIIAVMAYRLLANERALFSILLFVTTPLFAALNSSPGVDSIELLFDLASLFCFVHALSASRRAFILFLSGLLVGFGWISRETSIFLLVYYALLFLAGYRIKRAEYLIIAAGFLTVALGEMLAYYIVTGDALHRLKISLNHDLVQRNSIHSLFDREGNIHLDGPVGEFINPLLMIFFNKVFGLIFWLEVPAVVWLIRSSAIAPTTRTTLQAITIAGAVWMMGVFVLTGKLYLVPRYMLFPLCAASLLVGAWIALGLYPRSRRLALSIFAMGLAVNVLAINLEDHNYLFPERALVDFAKTTPGTIYTDHETFRRGDFLLQSENLKGRVTDRPHRLGDLFFYVPDNAGFKARVTGHEAPSRQASVVYRPLPGETVIHTFDRPEKWLARILDSVGLSRLLPPALMSKVRGNQRGAYLYAAPTSKSAGSDSQPPSRTN